MEELSEKLFDIKQNALREMRKALDAVEEAYNFVAEYNSEIDFNAADRLIDPNFLEDISRKVQEIERYMQWTSEETVALEKEVLVVDRRAA